MKLRKISIWLLGSITTLFLLFLLIGVFIDEPLRRYMERTVNDRLDGYTVRIGRLDFQPIGFSLDLEDFVISQDANPIPPMANIRKVSASVHWRDLLRAKIVADWQIVRPTVFINLTQTKKEAEDAVPVEERGWQEAVMSIYPLKINQLDIIDGDLTYVDNSPLKQIHLKQIQFRAENIVNARSEKNVYPSPVLLKGTLFDTGKIAIEGDADFLAEPHIGMKTDFSFEQIHLRDLEPLLRRMNLVVNKGTLSGNGKMEFAPETKVVHLEKITLDQAHADYIHTPPPASASREDEKRGGKVKEKTKEAAKEAAETETAPSVLVQVDEIEIKNGNIGFVNKASNPNYRIFLEKTAFVLTGFSNHLTKGATEAMLKGKFMGDGSLGAAATFRPQKKGPDLNLAISIEETDLKTMNNLLRAYGDFDVTAGEFSFFMELAVKEGRVNGYVKPLFNEVKVYDKEQDKKKGTFKKLYEGLIGGVGKLFENRRRDEVATRADLSGRIENPNMSTWEIVVGLIQNAFFQAILPGFEREIERGSE